ncbi:Oligosaccharide translocation protein rft1 [Orbilia brochopaga]|uniref:Ornithine decarboxylase antizyme n=1 Tax=Orbilia brochopaga TaxID=3140254 RepID=A0AAV9VGA6_9PEZI
MRQVFFGYGRKPAQAPTMDVSLKTSQGGNGNSIILSVGKSDDPEKAQLQQQEIAQANSVAPAGTKGPVRRLMRRSSELQTRVAAYLEVFDYVGGSAFRGFVSEKGPLNKPERSLFLFFDKGVNGTELKSGLVALIDLATECFDCQDLVICLDRETDGLDSLVHNLGWVGLELVTLKNWATQELRDQVTATHKLDKEYFTSDKWLFLGMEL